MDCIHIITNGLILLSLDVFKKSYVLLFRFEETFTTICKDTEIHNHNNYGKLLG